MVLISANTADRRLAGMGNLVDHEARLDSAVAKPVPRAWRRSGRSTKRSHGLTGIGWSSLGLAGEPITAPKKARGRPRKTTLAQDTNTAAFPRTVLGPPKLLKKVDLEARTASSDVGTPVVELPAMRIWPDRTSQPIERRPFRNVEIRPLGPGLKRPLR